MTAEVLQLEGVGDGYGPHAQVLSDVELHVRAGETVAITGTSGSGKSTLLHLAAGLRLPREGRVTIAGRATTGLSDDERTQLRAEHVGFVPQSAALVDELTLRDNVAIPLMVRGARHAQATRRATRMMELLGLAECASRRPAEVSGGQRQRAAIARAVVAAPSLICADEPTGALDRANTEIAIETLHAAAGHSGAALVLVTHDETVARSCDRVLELVDGTVLERVGA